MNKDIIWYAENICGVNLTETHKEILNALTEAKDGGQKIFLHYGRAHGIGILKRIFYGFEIWLKDHKIAVLERALELAVADKCKYENLMVEGIVGKGAKVAIPKKEQWYKEQAESDIKNEKE